MDAKTTTTMKSGEWERRQFEAWLPALFVEMNLPRTRELIPEIAVLSSETKIKRAISVFRQLEAEDPNPAMRASRQWSLEYFQAHSDGPEARRQFLIEEGIFKNGVRLKCPERVQPQMEIANFAASAYESSLGDEVGELSRLMYHEYFGVKSSLSFPAWDDLVSSLSARLPLLKKMFLLPQPRLKLSLLLRDYVHQTLAEAQSSDGLPLVAIFGPGKGEELVPLIKNQFSVLCFDAHDYDTLKSLFGSTFEQAGIPAPEFAAIGDGVNIDVSAIKTWQARNYPSTIFICPNLDFSQAEAIPEELYGISRVAASVYVFHEMCYKERLIENMTRVSRGAVVIFDGCPFSAAFDNVILPVSERCSTPITGHDAVITHLLCLTPEEMGIIARRIAPAWEWREKVVGPSIPAPFFYKLQGAIIGRRQ